MLVRIVKMTFKPELIPTFLVLFENNKTTIRQFNGCQFLELYQDKTKPQQFFTYSHWQDEESLENYRHSDIFKNIWTETKKMFAEKPEAWSVTKIMQG